MSRKRKVITIDGLAASGKSSLAKGLADRIKFTYFSSGMLYRMVGLLWVKQKGPKNHLVDEATVTNLFKAHKIDLNKSYNGELIATIDGEEVTFELFSPEVSEATSKLSAIKVVRDWLLDKQRTIFPDDNLVAEGRDMGTVVFPEADLKFFIKADLQTRIDRRIAQMVRPEMDSHAINSLKSKMEIEIIERDTRDSHRQHSPTIAAEDAVIIDNSAKTLTEVVESMYHLTAQRGLVP